MKISKVLLYQLNGQVLAQLFGFIVGILLVRQAGADVSGEYYSLFALLNIFFGVVASGIKTNFYRNGNIKYFNLSQVTILMTNLFIAIIICPIVVYYLNYNFFVFIKLALIIVGTGFLQNIIAWLRLKNRDIIGGFVNFMIPLLQVFLLLIFEPIDIESVTNLMLLGISPIILFSFYFFIIDRKAKLHFFFIYKYFKSSIVLVGTTILTALYGSSDLIFVRNLDSDENAGFYKIAVSLTTLIIPVFSIFSFVYLSKIQKLLKADSILKVIKEFKIQYKITIVLGFLYILSIIFLARIFIKKFYFIDNIEIYYTSIILSCGVICNILAMVNSYTLIALKKEKEIFQILVIATLGNLLLNLILIPYLSIIGAATISFFTQLTIFYLLFKKVRYNFKLIN